MFLWGWSTKNIAAKKLNVACKICDNKNLKLHLDQTRFTIFFIPMFPLNEYYSLYCDDCGTKYSMKLFDNPEIEATKFKTHWRSFSGSFISLFLFSLFCVLGTCSPTKNMEEFFEDPHEGDLLIFEREGTKRKELPYSFAKIEKLVEKIKDPNIVLRFSTCGYSHISAARKSAEAKFDEDLSTEPLEITMEDFKHIKIKDFIRK